MPFNFTASQLIFSMIFGSTGFVLFMFGKKHMSWKAMAAGGSLMALPYLLQDPVALCATGVLILVALYVFRD